MTWQAEAAESLVLAAIMNDSLPGVMMGIDLQIAEPSVGAEVMRQAEVIMSAQTLADYRVLRDAMRTIITGLKEQG